MMFNLLMVIFIVLWQQKQYYLMALLLCGITYRWSKHWKIILTTICCMLFMSYLRTSIKPDYFYICDYHPTYMTGCNLLGQKVLIYQAPSLGFGAIVKIGSPITRISSLQNIGVFNYRKYLDENEVLGAVKNINVIVSIKGADYSIYQYILSLTKETREWILYFIYGQGDIALFNLVISTGLALKSISSILISLLRLKYYEQQVKRVMLVWYATWLFFFPVNFSFWFYWIYNLVKYFRIYEKLDLQWIGWLGIINPTWSNAKVVWFFLFNRFTRLFNVKSDKFLYRMITRLVGQLCIFGSIDFLMWFGLPIMRFFGVLGYGFSFVALITGSFSLIFIDIIKYLDLIGRLMVINVEPGWFILSLVVGLWISMEHLSNRLLMALLVGLLWMINFKQFYNPLPQVTYLDVGQGDCALVSLPFHWGNYLIDCGSSSNEKIAEQVVVPYLQSRGIKWLDGIIISHQDKDHTSAIKNIIDSFPVYELIYQPSGLTKHGLSILNINYPAVKDNDSSLISLVWLNNIGFVFTGDIGSSIEYRLWQDYQLEKFSFLKLSHHGSSSSSSDWLLSASNWSLAVISSGYNNPYHHPSLTTLQRLAAYQVPYFNTAIDGMITVTWWGGLKYLNTGSGKFVIIK